MLAPLYSLVLIHFSGRCHLYVCRWKGRVLVDTHSSGITRHEDSCWLCGHHVPASPALHCLPPGPTVSPPHFLAAPPGQDGLPWAHLTVWGRLMSPAGPQTGCWEGTSKAQDIQSKNMCIFYFDKYCQIVPTKSCTNLQSYHHCIKVFISSYTVTCFAK